MTNSPKKKSSVHKSFAAAVSFGTDYPPSKIEQDKLRAMGRLAERLPGQRKK